MNSGCIIPNLRLQTIAAVKPTIKFMGRKMGGPMKHITFAIKMSITNKKLRTTESTN